MLLTSFFLHQIERVKFIFCHFFLFQTPQIPESPLLCSSGMLAWRRLSWCVKAGETPKLRESSGHGTVIISYKPTLYHCQLHVHLAHCNAKVLISCCQNATENKFRAALSRMTHRNKTKRSPLSLKWGDFFCPIRCGNRKLWCRVAKCEAETFWGRRRFNTRDGSSDTRKSWRRMLST